MSKKNRRRKIKAERAAGGASIPSARHSKKRGGGGLSFMARLRQFGRQFLMPPPPEAVHPMAEAEPTAEPQPSWRYLPWILLAAFAVRAAVSLAGDFVIHPDEIMQYLEPAHRLIFGSGVSYWEYFYGARSYIVPGFVAALLQICKWLGLDTPAVYIAVVKLAFAALSLLVPFGMYAAGRRLFGEKTGRCALLLGAFWYELIGFAHKPMTEFVATALFFLLLALLARPPKAGYPSPLTISRAITATALGVLLVAVRFHYAPLAGLVLLAVFLRAPNKTRGAMVAAAAVSVAAVGLLEYKIWGNAFHSYIINFQANQLLSAGRVDESSAWIFIGWLSLASGGLFLAACGVVLQWRRRHLWVLALLAAVLLPHMFEAHREYRFVFVAIPLYLWLLADVLAHGYGNAQKAAAKIAKWRLSVGFAYAGLVSTLGIFNALPFQHWVYVAFSNESGYVGFVRKQDPVFAVYRKLAADDSVQGVLDVNHSYFNTGGYYYLHKNIPFYDGGAWRPFFAAADAAQYVTHIVSGAPITPKGVVQADGGRIAMRYTDAYGEEDFVPLPGFINDATLGKLVYWNSAGQAEVLGDYAPDPDIADAGEVNGAIAVWKLTAKNPTVQQWESYAISPDSEIMHPLMRQATNMSLPPPVANAGIKISGQ